MPCVTGKSARAMLAALVGGETDPALLAERATGALRKKLPALEQAVRCQFGAPQQFLGSPQLAPRDYLDRVIEQREQEVAQRVRPCQAALIRLQSSNGWGPRGAESVVAAVGTDRSRFPRAAHLAAWAGRCPGQDERAGKSHRGKTRQGNPWLRSALVPAAHSVRRQRDPYVAALYRRAGPTGSAAPCREAVGEPGIRGEPGTRSRGLSVLPGVIFRAGQNAEPTATVRLPSANGDCITGSCRSLTVGFCPNWCAGREPELVTQAKPSRSGLGFGQLPP